MRLLNSVRSFGAAMRAGAAVGRSSRSRNGGHLPEALAEARRGLAVLAEPYVQRTNPAEASALASLTLMVEELAAQLGEPGASERDLSDSIRALKNIDGEPRPELCLSIPFLEQRLLNAFPQGAAEA